MNPDTIAAVATPFGSGGIGIVKISGIEAVRIAGTLFKHRGRHGGASTDRNISSQSRIELNGLQSHHLYYGHLVDPVSGDVLDEVLMTVMRAPHSYTREDVVEIQAHSGKVGLKAILEQVLRQGARLAEPGEFTKRAYANGRIDLTQAEAVIDIINAKTHTALNLAVKQNSGLLGQRIQSDRRQLMDLLAEVEAQIDFPDDLTDEDDGGAPDRERRVMDVRDHVQALIRSYQAGAIIREGLKIAIAGRTNVGKSSLLNCLLEKDRAIVTDIPGTTRDTIEDQIQISGVPFIITDTAGLQDTDDPIEKIGISKSRDAIEAVDLVLIVLEADTGFTSIDTRIFRQCASKAVLVVINKDDLATKICPGRLIESLPDPALPTCRVSAKYHQGIDSLKTAILAAAEGHYQLDAAVQQLTINLRHKTALEKCLDRLREAVCGLQTEKPLELVAMDLKAAVDHLGEITGEGSAEEVLDRIFSRFCIGK